MPRGDGTGPMGMGPMSGRAAGYCAGWQVPGFMNPYSGRGFGMGHGRGRGRGMGFGLGRGMAWGRSFGPIAPYPVGQVNPMSVQAERELLTQQAEQMQNQLDAIKKRLDELEKTSNPNE
ncbi:MAG: DUF5320 domain-containing protein [Sedimentisphaerales bacterium]|nr:DUF5320 domain-containing protein [Sedimentisphaerales bacterium]